MRKKNSFIWSIPEIRLRSVSHVFVNLPIVAHRMAVINYNLASESTSNYWLSIPKMWYMYTNYHCTVIMKCIWYIRIISYLCHCRSFYSPKWKHSAQVWPPFCVMHFQEGEGIPLFGWFRVGKNNSWYSPY